MSTFSILKDEVIEVQINTDGCSSVRSSCHRDGGMFGVKPDKMGRKWTYHTSLAPVGRQPNPGQRIRMSSRDVLGYLGELTT